VVNFFEFIAEEVREYLAQLGFRTLAEAVGQASLLEAAEAVDHWKAHGLDLAPVLYQPELPEGSARRNTTHQDHGIERALDNTLIQLAEGALQDGTPLHLELPVRNVNRTVGTMLGYEVTKRWGPKGSRTTRSTSRSVAPPGSRSARSCRAASRCGWPGTPTTTSPRAVRRPGHRRARP